jgi:EAL domain-containing protein (putative c-di-GMP-specific phosphodiesterase class I)/GGDEF domain-containing protein
MASQRYVAATRHALEAGRLADLRALCVLDSPPQPAIDQLTRLVAKTFGVSKCWVSLVDDTRQWFLSSVGLDVAEAPRDVSLCAHTINEPTGALIVPDVHTDSRFQDNPLATELDIAFYASIALHGPMRLPIGTLCIADQRPRQLNERDVDLLRDFAKVIVRELTTAAQLAQQAAAWSPKVTPVAAARTRPDRQAFTDVLSALLIADTDRVEAASAHVLYIQIRHVHAIQQRLSIAGFDDFMRTLGNRIDREIRANDLVAQSDHESFLVLLRNCSDSQRDNIAMRIHLGVQAALEVDGQYLVPSIRSGAATLHDTPEEAIANAILASKSMTTTVGSMHRTFASELAESARRWHDLDAALRTAIDYQQLSVVYQPKVTILSGSLSGAEALVRWSHPDLGPISPDEFIAVAEDSGYIVTLGLWVLRAACAQAVVWMEQDLLPGTIAVNVSPIQMQHPTFADDVRSILSETGLPPNRLELELTERAFAADVQQLAETMRDLVDSGVIFALDDFGTGFSSLKYLAELPFKTLKIDRYFVNRAEKDASIRAILRAIVAIAEPFKMRLVGEGIESGQQLSLLRKMNVHEGQGYYFARPMAGHKMTQFALEHEGLISVPRARRY